MVESEQKKALDLKQLTKKKATAQAQRQLQQLQRQEFAGSEDALTALSRWQKSLEWHHLQDLTIVEKPHYGHRGKPRPHEQPTRLSYHAQATLSLNIDKIQASERTAGRFVLATNQLYLARSWIEIFAPKIPQCWGTLKPINRERFPQNLVG